MLCQPIGQSQGQGRELEIQAEEISFLKTRLNEELANRTGQSIEKVAEDTDLDFFLSPTEAVAYGVIDDVCEEAPPISS